MVWMGKTELFSVILVGQCDPMNKPGVSEVKLRADAVQMNGLSPDEVEDFVSETMKSRVDADVVKRISGLPGCHNFEDLKDLLFRLMEQALVSGRRQVVLEDIEALFPAECERPTRKKARNRKAEDAKSIQHQTQPSKAEKSSLRDLLDSDEGMPQAAAG
jgi:hypothetical protein